MAAVCITLSSKKRTTHIPSKRRQTWGVPTLRFAPCLTDVSLAICAAVAAEHNPLRDMAVGLPCKSTSDIDRLWQAVLVRWIIMGTLLLGHLVQLAQKSGIVARRALLIVMQTTVIDGTNR